MPKIKIPIWALATVLSALGLTGNASPVGGLAAAEAAGTAISNAPTAIGICQSIAVIPMDVGEVLRLPLGALETVLFPLPGISLKGGLTNIGAGIIAPFKLTRDILALPYNILDGTAKLSKSAAAHLKP